VSTNKISQNTKKGRGMKRLAVALSSALSLAATLMAGPYDGIYAAYKEITVTPTAVSGSLASQTNFPLLVRFKNKDASTGADVLSPSTGSKNNGIDVRFTTADGSTPLAYEKERWTDTAADYWVRLPSISGTGGFTKIRVYFGLISAPDSSSSSAVFDTALGYRGVYHMNGATSTSDEVDATQNGFTATVFGAPAPIIGMAGSSRRLTVADAAGWDSAAFVIGSSQSNFALHMRDANNGVAVGNIGLALKTTDGGATWSTRKTGAAAAGNPGTGNSSTNNISLNSVACAPNNTSVCYAAGGGQYFYSNSTLATAATTRYIAKSTDGGETWAKSDSGVTQPYFGISCNSDTSCVAVGGNSTTTRVYTTLTTGGTAWAAPTSTSPTTLLNGVYCVGGDSVCYAVGGINARTRVIWRFNKDAGTYTLTRQDSVGANTAGRLNGVHCPTRDICYAVGDSGTVVKTTDGASTGTWTALTSGTTRNLRSVYCTSASTCVAVGTTYPGTGYTAGTLSPIIKTTDGGANWTTKSVAALSDSLWSVKFTDANNGIVVGANGTVLRSTDAGETWTMNKLSRKWAFNTNGSYDYNTSTSGAGKGDNYSISAWANVTLAGGGQTSLISKGEHYWNVQSTGGNLWNFAERNYSNAATGTYTTPGTGGTTLHNADRPGVIVTGWHHVAAARTNTADAETLFVNGGVKCGGTNTAQTGTFDTPTVLSNSRQGYMGAVAIGRGTDLYRRFWKRGPIDEVRVDVATRGEDWFCLSYQTQTPDTAAYYGKVSMGAIVNLTRSARTGSNAFNIVGNGSYSFELPAGYAESAELRIVDVVGRTVWSSSVRLNGKASTISWNGRDVSGNRVNAGVYFARLKTVNQGKTQELAIRGALTK
jgi:photosystem II stability/assembly factor-like uncharacterized protein